MAFDIQWWCFLYIFYDFVLVMLSFNSFSSYIPKLSSQQSYALEPAVAMRDSFLMASDPGYPSAEVKRSNQQRFK